MALDRLAQTDVPLRVALSGGMFGGCLEGGTQSFEGLHGLLTGLVGEMVGVVSHRLLCHLQGIGQSGPGRFGDRYSAVFESLEDRLYVESSLFEECEKFFSSPVGVDRRLARRLGECCSSDRGGAYQQQDDEGYHDFGLGHRSVAPPGARTGNIRNLAERSRNGWNGRSGLLIWCGLLEADEVLPPHLGDVRDFLSFEPFHHSPDRSLG